jgi:hypothetical protein
MVDGYAPFILALVALATVVGVGLNVALRIEDLPPELHEMTMHLDETWRRLRPHFTT